jgi:hypothetical protein
MTAAHDQTVTRRYVVHYPEHDARENDPHYVDFNHYHRTTRATARCIEGERLGFDTCLDAQGNPALPVGDGEQPGLELHHAHIEFAIQNGVDLTLLEREYPGVSNADELGAWVESAANLIWVCAYHHRGHPGFHVASKSDWEGEQFVRGLVS